MFLKILPGFSLLGSFHVMVPTISQCSCANCTVRWVKRRQSVLTKSPEQNTVPRAPLLAPPALPARDLRRYWEKKDMAIKFFISESPEKQLRPEEMFCGWSQRENQRREKKERRTGAEESRHMTLTDLGIWVRARQKRRRVWNPHFYFRKSKMVRRETPEK